MRAAPPPALAAVCLLLAAGPLAAQQQGAAADGDTARSELRAALEAHRRPLALENGGLTGPGAELLLSGARRARYTLVGETHGVAQAPPLVGALFRALQPHGYRHLAVEIGPVQAERIGELLAGPGGMERYRGFLREHWPAIPFYVWRAEAELLADAVRAVGDASALWGLDYDVMGGRYPVRRLRELAPGPTARSAADRLVRKADSLLRRATDSGEMSRILMFSEPSSTWVDLREAYDPSPGSEADRILTQLEATSRINEAWVAGERWTSNRRRVRLLKHNLLQHRAAADSGARVLVKMGGFHMTRGRTPNNTFDVGNLLSELARVEEGPVASDPAVSGGGRSFHVMVLGGPGRERSALDPETLGVRTAPTVVTSEEHWSHPLGRAACGDRWTAIDLRPLRPRVDAGELGDVPDDLRDMIFGYDVAVVLVGSTAAELLLPEVPPLPDE
jgi:hypothetical protein